MDSRSYARYEKRILAAVQKLEDDGYFENKHDKNFLVLGAFMMMPAQGSLDFFVSNSSSSVPMIAVVSQETGRTYLFALKSLASDIYDELYGQN